MGTVILDNEMLAKLGGVTQSVRLCNQAGEFVGYCIPRDAAGPRFGGPDPLSDEDTAEVLRTPDAGRPLADILADLRAR